MEKIRDSDPIWSRGQSCCDFGASNSEPTAMASEDEILSNLDRLHLSKVTTAKECNQFPPADADRLTAIRHSEYTTNRHRRHSMYAFETKQLLQSLQSPSLSRCSKWKTKLQEKWTSKYQIGKKSSESTKFTLRPSKLTILKPVTSSTDRSGNESSGLGGIRNRRKYVYRRNTLTPITEDEEGSMILSETTQGNGPNKIPKSCSQQATANHELNINELASYFDLYLHLPKKMSPMAEMMYT